MNTKIGEKVSVNFLYNHQTNQARPHFMRWRERVYKVEKIGLHYTMYRGNILIHIFAVTTQNHFALLSFNTKNLQWILEEIANMEAN